MAIIFLDDILDSVCVLTVDVVGIEFVYVYVGDVTDVVNFNVVVHAIVLVSDFINAVSTDGTISEATSDNLGGHLGAWVARPGAPAQWPPGAPTGFDDGPVRPPGAFCRTLLSLTAATV